MSSPTIEARTPVDSADVSVSGDGESSIAPESLLSSFDAATEVATPSAVSSAPSGEVNVEKVFKVSGGALPAGKSWAILCTKSVGGVDFIHLSNRDRQFGKFVIGTGYSPALSHFEYLNTLRTLRNHKVMMEMNSKMTSASKMLFGDDKTESTKYKQWQIRRKSLVAHDEAIVELDMPAVEYLDDHAPAMKIRLLHTRDWRENPSVEIDADTLNYIRIAMLELGKRADGRAEVGADASHEPEKGKVFWNKERNAWAAYRIENGKRVVKNFHCESDGVKRRKTAYASEEAKNLAVEWATHGSLTSSAVAASSAGYSQQADEVDAEVDNEADGGERLEEAPLAEGPSAIAEAQLANGLGPDDPENDPDSCN